jgi:hypothetical protein
MFDIMVNNTLVRVGKYSSTIKLGSNRLDRSI